MKTKIAVAAALVALAAGVAAWPAGADNPQLVASVGPGFTISLKDASGNDVRSLEPGTYDVVVHDLAAFHNFHLTGPGVNEATDIAGSGDTTWTVTFTAGTVTFRCDPHPDSMKGSFTVGPAVSPPPPPVTPSPPRQAVRLLGAVGPGSLIQLTSMAGRKVRALRPNAVEIRVVDRSRTDNFHLVGPGVNRRTAVAGTGSATWRLTLRSGIYRYSSDAHPKLRGTLTVALPPGG